MSSPPNCPLFKRKDSLISRFILLRVTAFRETFLDTARPRRALLRLFGMYRTKKKGPWSLFAFLKTAAKSDPLKSLSSLLKCPDTPGQRDPGWSGAQACSAASTSCINDGAPATGAHSGTKTVTTFTFYYARLKCSFHGSGFLFRVAAATKPEDRQTHAEKGVEMYFPMRLMSTR